MKIDNEGVLRYINHVNDLKKHFKHHKAELIEWVNRLESGNYKQCKDALRSGYMDDNGHYGYCCLGVASFVNEEWENLRKQSCSIGTWESLQQERKLKIPPFLAKIDDLSFLVPYRGQMKIHVSGTSPAELNDAMNFSFREIAQVIRFNFPNFFEEDVGYKVTTSTKPNNLGTNENFVALYNKLLAIREKRNCD